MQKKKKTHKYENKRLMTQVCEKKIIRILIVENITIFYHFTYDFFISLAFSTIY